MMLRLLVHKSSGKETRNNWFPEVLLLTLQHADLLRQLTPQIRIFSDEMNFFGALAETAKGFSSDVSPMPC
jgi:hypothetical protein